MTEHDNLFNLTPQQRQNARDVQNAREHWDKEQAELREQRETEKLQAELESYLTRRGEDFRRMTGRAPTEAEMQSFQLDYANARESEQQAERRQRIDATKHQIF